MVSIVSKSKTPFQFSPTETIVDCVPTMGNQFSKGTTQPSPLLSCPWRDSPPFDSEHLAMLKERVENYSPPSRVGAKRAKILMLGPVGAGKSSFFNTIYSISHERIAQQAMTGSYSGTLTKTYREYPIWSPRKGSELNFRLCDTCGIVVKGPPDLVDLEQLLEGNVPNGYEFSEKLIDSKIRGYISKPELEDKVHCVAYVFAASSLKTMNESIWVKLNDLQHRLNMKEIPSVVLLTKIDMLSETLAKDLKDVFKCAEVKEAVDCVSEKLRVPPGSVMPIKNYERESMVNNNISSLALQALDRMLGYANDFLDNQHQLKQRK